MFKLFKKKKPAVLDRGGYYEKSFSKGKYYTLKHDYAVKVTAHNTPFKGVYYIDKDSLPMRRELSLRAALKDAANNISTNELDELLVEIYAKAHNQKDISKLKISLQSDIDNIRQRMSLTDIDIRERLAFQFMLIEGENPFFADGDFDDKKKEILSSPAAQDFFLRKAGEILSGFLS